MALLMYKWLLMVATFFNFYLIPGETFNKEKLVHPFYVSVTEINHNNKEKTLEISCKIFTDDLEATLNRNYNARIDFFSGKTDEQAQNLLSDYMNKHFLIMVDGKPVKAELLGFERESEAIWSYYQVNDITSVKKMQVRNSILYDSHKEQINLMHVTVNGVRKSTKLNYPDIMADFNY
jgi:hypothetical protein